MENSNIVSEDEVFDLPQDQAKVYDNMRNALVSARLELLEWNAESEAAAEIQEVLDAHPDRPDIVIEMWRGIVETAYSNDAGVRVHIAESDPGDDVARVQELTVVFHKIPLLKGIRLANEFNKNHGLNDAIIAESSPDTYKRGNLADTMPGGGENE